MLWDFNYDLSGDFLKGLLVFRWNNSQVDTTLVDTAMVRKPGQTYLDELDSIEHVLPDLLKLWKQFWTLYE